MKLQEQWVKTELTPEHYDQSPLASDREQAIDTPQIMSKWFLYVEVAARLGRRQGDFKMPGAGCRDHGRRGSVAKGFFQAVGRGKLF